MSLIFVYWPYEVLSRYFFFELLFFEDFDDFLAAFFPPFLKALFVVFLPRPLPLFLPPPDSLFTVAQARRAASFADVPRSS